MGMAPSTTDIMDNCKLAREMSLMGNYQGVITQISKLLTVMEEPARQPKWRNIQAKLTQECELVQNIQTPLSSSPRKADRIRLPSSRSPPETRTPGVSPPPPSLREVEQKQRRGMDSVGIGRGMGAVLRLQLV